MLTAEYVSLRSLKCAQLKAFYTPWIINGTILHVLLNWLLSSLFRLFAQWLQWNNHNGIFPDSSVRETDTDKPEWKKVQKKEKTTTIKLVYISRRDTLNWATFHRAKFNLSVVTKQFAIPLFFSLSPILPSYFHLAHVRVQFRFSCPWSNIGQLHFCSSECLAQTWFVRISLIFSSMLTSEVATHNNECN